MTIRLEIADSRGNWYLACETGNYACTVAAVAAYHDATGTALDRIRATVV